MKSFAKMIASAGLILAAGAGIAATQGRDLCEGFVPQNKMRIPVGTTRSMKKWAATTGGITEQQFNDVMDRVERLYGDDVKSAGGVLKINRLWTDETVNASAQQFGTTWVLNMYGGLARHKATTVEGMALVACHELGHHLGGAPRFAGWGGTSEWASNEGAADYFATLKCLRRYFLEDDNAAIIAATTIDPLAKDRCTSQFTSPADQLICMRTTMGAQSVTALFMDLSGDTTAAQFNTPDASVVTEMFDAHPATQCRMDTYFNGATCHVDKSVGNSATDYKQGSCVQGTDQYGWRPLCWFFPATANPTPTPAPTPGGNSDGDDDGGDSLVAHAKAHREIF